MDRGASYPSEDRTPLGARPPSGQVPLEARLSLFDRAERIGGLGSWEWTPDTGQLLWSDNHFRLFGHAPGGIEPSIEFLIAHVHPADRQRFAAAVADVRSGADLSRLDYRLARADGAIRHMRTTIGTDDGPVAPRVFGCVQDVTNERHADRNLRAYAAVAKAVDDWEEFESGALGLLSGVSEAMDFSFGALWLPQGTALTPRAVWHRSSPALEAIRRATTPWRPGQGSPVLGLAWRTAQPQVSPRPWAGSPAPRAEAIREGALTAVVAIPAVTAGEPLAILEFLASDPIAPTDQLMRALTGIGYEVGHVLALHRGELVEAILTPRERQVLQLTARAYSAHGIAVALGLSSATVKRHFESAYAKLGVSTRAAAVAEAMRQGSIT